MDWRSWCVQIEVLTSADWRSWSVQHDRSILHLDLKPGNVLLTWDEGKLM